jgi:hypothetical protein
MLYRARYDGNEVHSGPSCAEPIFTTILAAIAHVVACDRYYGSHRSSTSMVPTGPASRSGANLFWVQRRRDAAYCPNDGGDYSRGPFGYYAHLGTALRLAKLRDKEWQVKIPTDFIGADLPLPSEVGHDMCPGTDEKGTFVDHPVNEWQDSMDPADVLDFIKKSRPSLFIYTTAIGTDIKIHLDWEVREIGLTIDGRRVSIHDGAFSDVTVLADVEPLEVEEYSTSAPNWEWWETKHTANEPPITDRIPEEYLGQE